MSQHPIQAPDDLMRVTGMEFGLMAEKMREASEQLRAEYPVAGIHYPKADQAVDHDLPDTREEWEDNNA